MASQSTVTGPSKRKADSNRAPRPRKKQAVTKMFKRSTIKKIERNALNSPLLSLPGEIREKILRLVVGERVIHINVCNFGVKGQVTPGYHQGSLCHDIRTGPGKTCECFTHTQMLPIDHCLCRLTSNGPVALHQTSPTLRFHQRNKVKVSILAASRQLYEECNLLIWHTNTFSFEEPSAFTSFLKRLNVQQRKNIRNLQIRPFASQSQHPGQYAIYHEDDYDEYEIVSVQDWKLGDSRNPLIHRLHGMKNLRIHMKYVGSYPMGPSNLQLELAFSSLQVLRSMPLEHATVQIDIQPAGTHDREAGGPNIKLLAAKFQEMLLDPAGAEKVKEVGVHMKGSRLHAPLPGNIFCSQDIYYDKD